MRQENTPHASERDDEMKRVLVGLICWILAAGPLAAGVEANGTTSQPGVADASAGETDQVIVVLQPGAAADSLEEYEIVDSELAKEENLVTVEIPAQQSTESFMEELEEKREVLLVEPDYIIQRSEVQRKHIPSDPDYPSQWHHQRIESEAAWTRTKGSKEVVVAVIDDGADLHHPDLQGRILSPYDAVKGMAGSIPAGEHGTHVAGIVAGSMDNGHGGTGVAPNARIMPINVFRGEFAYTSDIIKGINYAVSAGADVINMSLGTYYYSSAFDAAVQQAYQSGAVVVAAAGNESARSVNYPAAFPNVIAVSATNSSDAKAYFSNYGPNVDLAAPGSNIYSTLPYGFYGGMSGTSMASPVVAGVAALVWSSEPGLTNKQVESRLYGTADDLGTPGKDEKFGHGRVNAKKALKVKELKQPLVHAVSDMDGAVTGMAYESGTVEVRSQNVLLGSAPVNGQADFTIPIPKQHAGTLLKVKVVDSYGNASKQVEVSVQKRTVLASPVVGEMWETMKAVRGSAPPFAGIQVKTKGGVYTGEADEQGNFEVAVPLQPAGSTLEVTASDSEGNVSSVVYVQVLDKTAPAPPKVNSVTDASKTVKGTSEAYAKIEVKSRGRLISAGAAGADGKFEAGIPVQKAGAELTVTALDKAGNASKAVTITVKDATPPGKPAVNTITDKSTKVTGKAEPYAAVEVKVNGKNIGAGKAGSDRSFSVTIPVQKAGVKLHVTATDAAGNTSGATVVTVKDVTPPALKVNAVSDRSREITGSAEAGATVKAAIGNSRYSGKADGKGSFKIAIPRQKAGVKISVSAVDGAGNASPVKTVVVLDKTPPGQPTVNAVSDKSKAVTGKAEAGASVTVGIGNKKYSGKADAKGAFKVAIPLQKAGTKLSVTARDKAGNTSSARTMTVLGKTPPAAPKVTTKVKSSTREISGTAERNSAITIKAGSKVIGTAKTSSKGKFKVKIKAQRKNTQLKITATDSAKNVSKATVVKVK
ncbi:Ig-like domain-containing protein [Bacillus sp. FJAT-27251]|uniref:S8 family peptidase n=1 Tax=Bacillus sp. FJAT-27251 TaxID=1684142 RepID=UPI0006A7A016|nr:Ig-like domain-containing protein [Bacillus sp. FJAT-27251]